MFYDICLSITMFCNMFFFCIILEGMGRSITKEPEGGGGMGAGV